MDKRVMIFSPEIRDLEDLTLSVESFFRRNFPNSRIERGRGIQPFQTLNESSEKGLSIGEGGEILVVFDRRMLPKDERKKSYREIGIDLFRREALDMSKKYCNDNKIPHILYEGEISQGIEKAFLIKLNGVKESIQNRLILNYY